MAVNEPEQDRELQYLCCFCGQFTANPSLLSVVLDWTDDREENEEGTQYFFAHPACVVDLMVPDARKALFSDDDEGGAA